MGRVAQVGVCALVLAACSAPAAGPALVSSPSAPPAVSASTPSVPETGVSVSPSPIPTAPPDSPTPIAVTEPPGFAIQTHSRTDLQNYSQFTYMTATTTGLAPEAAATADERITGTVDAVVSAAVADDDRECLEGEPKCGYFEQTLKPIACRNDYLCLEQHVSAAPVGLAISDEQVAVLVLDPATGRTANVSDVVSESDREGFLASVNDAVKKVQQSYNVYDSSNAPNLAEPDFAAWAPLPDGIRVWFAKYTAGPGALGVVDVTVPYPGRDTPDSATVLEPRWYAIKDAPSDPLYAFPLRIEPQSDGSYVLTADPVSPDTKGILGPACGTWSFARPAGSYCLVNTTQRKRKVTVLPTAEIGINDDFVTMEKLDNFLGSNRSLVVLGLDSRGYVNSIWGLGYDPS